MSPIPARRRSLLSCLGLVVAVFAVYRGVGSHGFVALDTKTYLLDNPRVLRGLSAEGVRWAFTSFHASNWHPLTWISHMLDVDLFGLRPGPHNFENAAWHAANACLVFLVLQSATRAWGRSLLVAAFFALHPLHVESVAWIVERKDLLAAFFGLASLGAWTAWVRSGRRAAYVGALLLFAVGLLCKPMLVTWPFVLLLLDRWPFARGRLGARALLVEKLPWMILAIASSIVTWSAQSSGGALRSLEHIPLSARFANAVVAYGTYLARTFWPANLSFFYPHAVGRIPTASVVAAAAVLLAATALALRSLANRPWIAVGWFFFLGTLVPVIGIVQVGWQSMADRYTYLPLLGVFVPVVWTVGEWIEANARVRPWRTEIAGIPCLLLAFLAARQVGFWRDTETLCEHAIAVDPRNYVAHDLLGLVHIERNELDRAEAELRQAVAIEPEDDDAQNNLGSVLHRLGRTDEAEEVFRRLSKRYPERADLRRSLALSVWAQGRNAEALLEIEAALKLDPDLASAHLTRGQILEQSGRAEDALAEFERALLLRPGYVEARMALARALVRRGDLARAEEALRRAVQDAPNEPEAHRGLGLLLLARGKATEALGEANTALKLRPGWALSMGDIAWILALSEDPAVRDPRSAVGLAEQAASLTQERHAGILDALAAAYAASGAFEPAVATAEKALALAAAGPDPDFAQRVSRRLSAYRENRMDRAIPR